MLPILTAREIPIPIDDIINQTTQQEQLLGGKTTITTPVEIVLINKVQQDLLKLIQHREQRPDLAPLPDIRVVVVLLVGEVLQEVVQEEGKLLYL